MKDAVVKGDTLVGGVMTDGLTYRIEYQRGLGWYWQQLPEDGEHALQGPFKTEWDAFADYVESVKA